MGVKLSSRHLVYMNIGRKYWDADLSKLTSSQKKALGRYLATLKNQVSSGIGLFIWGPNSTGKSYIAGALCKKVWSSWRVTSYCVTASQMKDSWIDDQQASYGSEETVVERIEAVRFLVIDDLGKEHRAASGFAENKFGALLRSRVRSNKTTVITTNMDPKEFGKTYGESTSQLAKECFYPVKLDGVNMRDKASERIVRQVEKGSKEEIHVGKKKHHRVRPQ